MNQVIESDVETVCLLTSPQFAFISSSLVREIASLGQPVSHWVPKSVAERLRVKLETNRSAGIIAGVIVNRPYQPD